MAKEARTPKYWEPRRLAKNVWNLWKAVSQQQIELHSVFTFKRKLARPHVGLNLVWLASNQIQDGKHANSKFYFYLKYIRKFLVLSFWIVRLSATLIINCIVILLHELSICMKVIDHFLLIECWLFGQNLLRSKPLFCHFISCVAVKKFNGIVCSIVQRIVSV